MVTGAKKRNAGISGYYLVIGGERIDFDIRFIGDKYIDPSWAKDCLDKKHLVNGVYVLDDINQLFTTLYHCLLQKKKVSDYYNERIRKLYWTVFGSREEKSEEELCENLARYMSAKKYVYEKPLDAAIIKNNGNIRLIKRYTLLNINRKKRMRDVYIRTPFVLRKLLPRKVKGYLIKFFDTL